MISTDLSSSGSASMHDLTELSGEELIEKFQDADRSLRICIEQGDDQSIRDMGAYTDMIFDRLVNFETDDKIELKNVMEFLVDRFVVNDISSADLRRQVCDRLLKLI